MPADVAGLYKVCIGAIGALTALSIARWAGGGSDLTMVDAADVAAFVDDNALLIGRREACAGSPAMVLAFLRILLGDNGAKRGAPAPGPCAMVPDAHRLLDYASVVTRMEWLKRLFAFRYAWLVKIAAGAPTSGWQTARQDWQARHDLFDAPVEAFCGELGAETRQRIVDVMASRVGVRPAPSAYGRALPVATAELWEWATCEAQLLRASLAARFGFGLAPITDRRIGEMFGPAADVPVWAPGSGRFSRYSL